MEAKELDEEITQYLPRLNELQKEAVLSIIKSFANGQQDWWDEVDEDMQEAIDKSLAEMKNGKLTPHDEVMEDIIDGIIAVSRKKEAKKPLNDKIENLKKR